MSDSDIQEEETPLRKYRTFSGQAQRLAAYIRKARSEASEKKTLTAEVFDPATDNSDGYRKII
jgi:hypothetical protein